MHQKINNINDTFNSNLVYAFLKEKNIVFSENNNGIFLNISCLTDNHTKGLHDYITSLKTYSVQLPEINTDKSAEPVNKKQQKQKEIIHYGNLDLNDLETLILSYSFE